MYDEVRGRGMTALWIGLWNLWFVTIRKIDGILQNEINVSKF